MTFVLITPIPHQLVVSADALVGDSRESSYPSTSIVDHGTESTQSSQQRPRDANHARHPSRELRVCPSRQRRRDEDPADAYGYDGAHGGRPTEAWRLDGIEGYERCAVVDGFPVLFLSFDTYLFVGLVLSFSLFSADVALHMPNPLGIPLTFEQFGHRPAHGSYCIPISCHGRIPFIDAIISCFDVGKSRKEYILAGGFHIP